MTDVGVNNQSFEFAYSAKQQKEIEEIRKKYLPKEEDKMETLRRLDKSAEKPGTMAGIIGTMLLGVGMCCTMVWQIQFVYQELWQVLLELQFYLQVTHSIKR